MRLLTRSRCTTYLGLLCLAFFAAACGDAEGQEEASGRGEGDPTLPSVEAVQARYGGLPLRERLTGTVRGIGQVAIYPETNGLITEILVQNGDQVQQGQPLVRLKALTSQAQLGQAQANLNVAQAEASQAQADLEELEAQLQRTEALAQDSLVSQEEFETQQAQVRAARANYERAQAQVAQAEASIQESEGVLSQTVVRSPTGGRVGQRNAEVGMRVDGSTQLFTVGRLDEVRVEVPVTQEMIGRFQEGQTVELSVTSRPDTVIIAEVSRISPFLEEGSFSAEAEIDVPNGGELLRPGMFVTADVFYGESQQATLLPRSALYENPDTGVEGVYVATSLGLETQPAEPGEDGTGEMTTATPMRFQPVEVLAEGGQLVGLSGVDQDAWVVVVGQHLLSNQAEDGAAEARVRPVTWERIAELQSLQRQDLLRQFMEKQQRLARQQRADSVATASAPPSQTAM